MSRRHGQANNFAWPNGCKGPKKKTNISAELSNACLLFLQLEGTKNITERRQLRAELRTLRDKKERMTDENGNNSRTPAMSSKFTMAVGSSEKESYQERANRINREESPARKENVAPKQPRNTRSTFSFKMANKEESAPENRPSESNTWRHPQPSRVRSNIEEKRPRRNQDINNNDTEVKREKEKDAETPQRVSRRSSLAELFKIDQEALIKSREQETPTPPPQLTVSPSPIRRMPMETHQDTKTKQDLIQNLGRLRGRRRSVREIERKEELDGLMYVKSGDSVKLVNTSEGDEQVKEQRKTRRSSRKESHEKLTIEGNTISNRSETELTAIQESPRSPNAKKRFEYGNENNQPPKRFEALPKREEPPKATRIWQPPPPRDTNTGAGRASKQWSDPGPQRVGPPRPNSFLPSKTDVSFFVI